MLPQLYYIFQKTYVFTAFQAFVKIFLKKEVQGLAHSKNKKKFRVKKIQQT